MKKRQTSCLSRNLAFYKVASQEDVCIRFKRLIYQCSLKLMCKICVKNLLYKMDDFVCGVLYEPLLLSSLKSQYTIVCFSLSRLNLDKKCFCSKIYEREFWYQEYNHEKLHFQLLVFVHQLECSSKALQTQGSFHFSIQ